MWEMHEQSDVLQMRSLIISMCGTGGRKYQSVNIATPALMPGASFSSVRQCLNLWALFLSWLDIILAGSTMRTGFKMGCSSAYTDGAFANAEYFLTSRSRPLVQSAGLISTCRHRL